MKVNICDICRYQDGRHRISKWRLSFKKRVDQFNNLRIALDACDEHKNWLKQFKNFDEADKAIQALYSGQKPVPALVGDVEGKL